MKRLLALLLIPSVAFSDIGVVRFRNGHAEGKEIFYYTSDPVQLQTLSLDQRTAADPSVTFQLFVLPDPAFDNFIVPDTTISRNQAINSLVNGTTDRDKLERAILLTILDQLNVLGSKVGIANITPQQAKTAVQNKINSGASD